MNEINIFESIENIKKHCEKTPCKTCQSGGCAISEWCHKYIIGTPLDWEIGECENDG